MLDIDLLFDKLARTGKQFRSFVYYRGPEAQLLIMYSLAYLEENYVKMAEESMKQKKEYEATYFSAKAVEIRNFCISIFGHFPDKDYYTDTFKMPKDMYVSIPNEILNQVAQFCASNIEVDEELAADQKLMVRELYKSIRTFRKISVIGKYASKLLLMLKEAQKKPPKLMDVYELTMLLANILEVQKAFKEQETNGTAKTDKKQKGKKRPRASDRW